MLSLGVPTNRLDILGRGGAGLQRPHRPDDELSEGWALQRRFHAVWPLVDNRSSDKSGGRKLCCPQEPRGKAHLKVYFFFKKKKRSGEGS